MKPTPREASEIKQQYESVVDHLIKEGYADDKEFWDTLLRVGEEYDEEELVEDTGPKLSISDRFRSSKRRSNSDSGARTTSAGNRDGGPKPNNDRSGEAGLSD